MDQTKAKHLTLWRDTADRKLRHWRREIDQAQAKLEQHGQEIGKLPTWHHMVCALLLAEDPDLQKLLTSLNNRLQEWLHLEDLASKAGPSHNLLDELQHQARLAQAVCNLMDHITTRADAHQALLDWQQEVPL